MWRFNKALSQPLLLRLFLPLVFLLALCWPVQAHWADMAALDLQLKPQAARATLTLATPFLKFADANANGKIEPQELAQHRPQITRILNDKIQLKVNHEVLEFSVDGVATLESELSHRDNMSSLTLGWYFVNSPQQVDLIYTLFPEAAPNAHCLLNLNNQLQEKPQMRVLILKPGRNHSRLNTATTLQQFQHFVVLGLEHIVTGYDHLLFLFALLLVGGALKYLLKIVSAFTLAHSLTLSLAVMGWVYAPSRWVESLIAASILYVVVVEFLWKRQETPGYVVFLFGLIHGLGFANLLKDMTLARDQLAVALLSFNLGIEVGQLLIVLCLWAVIVLINKYQEEWYPKIQNFCAVAILLLASYWFVERLFAGA